MEMHGNLRTPCSESEAAYMDSNEEPVRFVFLPVDLLW